MENKQKEIEPPPSYENLGFVTDKTDGTLEDPAPQNYLPRVALDGGKQPPIGWNVEDPEGKTGGDDKEVIEDDGRDTWDNPIEFLMSCISMSVGLGNIWRFPAVAARNGGGAFLIPYLLVLFFIGRPLYYLEMCLGQFSRFGQVKIWNMAPLFKGVGYGAIVGVISLTSYYCALMAITTYYFFASMAKTLPWDKCHQEDLPEGLSCNDSSVQSSLTAFYYNSTAFPQKYDINDGLGTLHWELALCLLFSWLVIFVSLSRGVKSSGKVAYFTALFPYVVLIILLIRGVTLKGAWTGIRIFLEPQWKELYNPKVWYAAVEQCFFSLATGFGVIVMFTSYNPFRQNVYKDALIISIMDTSTSLLAGITIFSVIGNLMEENGLKREEIADGTGLAFILYPQALAKFGNGASQFFSVLFFLMLFTLGLGTASSLTGGIITIICDQFTNWRRIIVTAVVSILMFFAGLMYVTEGGPFMIDLIDHYGAGFIIYVMAICETAGICYVYGLSNICQDIEFMIGRKPGIYWKVCWAFIIPVGLFVNLVYYLATQPEFTSGVTPYPKQATICGWMLTAFAVSLVPAWAIHAVATRKATGWKEKFLESLRPTSKWGPQDKKIRKEWEEFKAMKKLEGNKKRFWLC